MFGYNYNWSISNSEHVVKSWTSLEKRKTQDLSRKCSAWKDFGLLFWSLLLQRKIKVCGLRWGGMDELEVKSLSLALDKGTYKSLDSWFLIGLEPLIDFGSPLHEA